MSPSHVRSKLTRRLGYLKAQLERGMPPERARWNLEEIAVLEHVLERLGLMDARLVAAKVRAVTEKVLPVQDRKDARRVQWRQSAEQLVESLYRAARVT